ncbi:MAG: MerR family transcriptional regulator [Hyphomonadaceae bacterium]|nr:MerR family transcriptional regulator [Hyphomonadaceae bacterium]
MGAAAVTKTPIQKSADAYRSIGEAASELGLPTHVLRYWETKFPRQVRPVKRPDGRRMFRPQDIQGLRAIQTLVHQRGMTLKGAKSLLTEQGVDAVLSGEARVVPVEDAAARPTVHVMQDKVAEAFGAEKPTRPDLSNEQRGRLEAMLTDLTDLKARLDAARMNRAA